MRSPAACCADEGRRPLAAHDRTRRRRASSCSIRRGCRSRSQWLTLRTLDDVARAIRDMHVRGAPLIGATAAWGVALALREGATRSSTRADGARGDAADRGQSALGARARCARARRSRERRARAERDLRRGCRARARRSATAGLPVLAARREPPLQRAHALQRRLARDRRLGHRARADLRGARGRACRCTCGSTRRGRATRAC